MVELSGLAEKLRLVNGGWCLAHTIYLYRDQAYYTIYGIIGPYKNYPEKPQIPVQEKFNKAIARL